MNPEPSETMAEELPFLLGGVTVLSALHMGYLAKQVGQARMAHKIMPPAVTGPPEFERTFRAHQNCVEFYPIFLAVLWTSGLFFNEWISAGGGMVYILARQMYFNGYVRCTKERLPGFYLTLASLCSLAFLSITGILWGILLKYFGLHI